MSKKSKFFILHKIMTLKHPVSQSVGSFVLSVQTIAAAGQRQFLEFSKRGVQVKRKKERKKEEEGVIGTLLPSTLPF